METKEKVFIQDNYTNLKFKQLNNISELKVGMMIQIVESNKRPLTWEWHEVTERTILFINDRFRPNNTALIGDVKNFVRIPNYAINN